jgi:DNA-binding LacI/PurR family transcriptional regulator
MAPPGPTIVDVARLSGVSIATVSNLINGRTGRMRPETRERVERAIAELGFLPNRAAQKLKTGQSQMLGLLVPSMSNPSYAELAREIEEVAQARYNQRLIVANTYRDASRERPLLEDLLSHGVRGAIIISSLAEAGHFDALIQRGLIAVSYDSHARPGVRTGMDHVSVDNAAAAALAVNHLVEQGHRSLAFLVPAGRTFSRAAKLDGFRQAAGTAGVQAAVIERSSPSAFGDAELADLGQSLAAEVLEHPARPTGLVAVNDMMAIGLLAGLHRRGVSVPGDLSVVGMDALPLTGHTIPALTSVRSPLPEMARLMVDRIMRRMEDASLPPEQFSFPPSLVLRDSVAPLVTAGA